MNTKLMKSVNEVLVRAGVTITKDQAISVMLTSMMDAGWDVGDAIDEVLGEGTFEHIVSDVYDALRAKITQ